MIDRLTIADVSSLDTIQWINFRHAYNSSHTFFFSGVAMHRFPSQEKFPERFKTWVTLCGGKLETSADYYNYKEKRVCDRHFVEKDHNRNKRLNALAVPSLYLAGKNYYLF